jgi:hypothetical protein
MRAALAAAPFRMLVIALSGPVASGKSGLADEFIRRFRSYKLSTREILLKMGVENERGALMTEGNRLDQETDGERAIFERFRLPHPLSPEVKAADLRVLASEQRQVMPPGTARWADDARIEPAPMTVVYLSPESAKRRFLERFSELTAEAACEVACTTRGAKVC